MGRSTPLAVGAMLFLTAAFAAPANAQHLAPTLSGERLDGTMELVVTGTCNPAGRSTFSYTARGPASGPYVGVFEESGTFTIGPMIDPKPGHPSGEILSFSARFAVQSIAPSGSIEGRKAVRGGQAGGGAACWSSPSGDGVTIAVAEGLVYRATIETLENPREVCRDTGTSVVSLYYGETAATFQESFGSDDGAARCGGPG